MKKLSVVLSSLIAAATLISATPAAHAEHGYGAAGCGLGSMVFGSKPGLVQVLAATTNGTLGSQTFGITTGTSNCKAADPGMVGAQAFIQTNREAFAKDVSRGRGETINSLSKLAGCEDSKAVGSVLQKEYKSIFPTSNASDQSVSESAVKTLKSHSELSCRKVG